MRFLITLILALLLSLPALAEDGALQLGAPSWPVVSGNSRLNPVLPGAGDLTRPELLREKATADPRWVVAGDLDGDKTDELVSVLDDGTVEVHTLKDGVLKRIEAWRGLSPDAQPLMSSGEDGPGVLLVDDRGDLALHTLKDGAGKPLLRDLSLLTGLVRADLDGDGKEEVAAAGEKGELSILDGEGENGEAREPGLLPDARLAAGDLDGDGKLELVTLTRPREGVADTRLGDAIEAQGVAVWRWDGRRINLLKEHRLTGEATFEALGPVLAELDGAPGLEILIPVLVPGEGESLRRFTFGKAGLREENEGPRVKAGSSWQALAGVPGLGEQGRAMVLARSGSAEKGVLEALRPDLANTRLGTADNILPNPEGSRLTETAVAFDATGDGKPDLVAPGRDGTSIRAFTFSGNALVSRELATFPKAVCTNLCPADVNGDGKRDLAFGCRDGYLVVLLGK